MMRYFDLDDNPTVSNLRRLDHLAGQKCSGTYESFDGLLGAAIGSIRLLPSSVAKHFYIGRFYTNGAHWSMAPASRTGLWKELSAELADGLNRVLSDPGLQAGAKIDFSDRPQTLGERVEILCDELEAAMEGRGRDPEVVARELARVGAGSPVGSDGKELEKLLGRKRIPDWDRHRQELVRLLWHARDVAQHLHHRPASS